MPGSFSGSVVDSAISERSTPESLIGLTSIMASSSSAPGLSAVVTFALSTVSSVALDFWLVVDFVSLVLQYGKVGVCHSTRVFSWVGTFFYAFFAILYER